ncbi:MAG TPA: hypothetical protein VKR24_00430 [Candidatus Limnocylindrales bacterium]|nr:hypothetical protein [Candidatus Limnocylindrales bacterium]
MRKLLASLSIACLIGMAVAVPASATTLSNAKIVIIVGPVEGTTPSYIADANDTAAVAREYSSNVLTFYSPNATWSKVEPALQGASIVVYFGHGNGWPSPYTPFQENTKDGLGLNGTANAGNSNVKYYGANYLAQDVKLAPNAVVILGHLCYSAGNSESGNPAPTMAVAQERVDNMGAGWRASGARAVISEPYSNEAGWYIQSLFTTHQTIGALWLSAPNFNDNVTSMNSVRTSWATVQLDPNPHVSGNEKFQRAISGDMSLTTDAVVGTPIPSPYSPVSLTAPGVTMRGQSVSVLVFHPQTR